MHADGVTEDAEERGAASSNSQKEQVFMVYPVQDSQGSDKKRSSFISRSKSKLAPKTQVTKIVSIIYNV